MHVHQILQKCDLNNVLAPIFFKYALVSGHVSGRVRAWPCVRAACVRVPAVLRRLAARGTHARARQPVSEHVSEVEMKRLEALSGPCPVRLWALPLAIRALGLARRRRSRRLAPVVLVA